MNCMNIRMHGATTKKKYINYVRSAGFLLFRLQRNVIENMITREVKYACVFWDASYMKLFHSPRERIAKTSPPP